MFNWVYSLTVFIAQRLSCLNNFFYLFSYSTVMMESALMDHEPDGPLCDLLQMLLCALFNLQEEEAEEYQELEKEEKAKSKRHLPKLNFPSIVINTGCSYKICFASELFRCLCAPPPPPPRKSQPCAYGWLDDAQVWHSPFL